MELKNLSRRGAEPGCLRLERRDGEREPREGWAMAAFYDEDGALSLTQVELVDASGAGLGLWCPVEVEPGARFCLYSGATRLPHTTGVVARCVPDEDGFRVGLKCAGRMAA